MKPLSLVMEAFGPFQRRQKVDFSVLNHRRLFLIVGDTGSGKTTIFDAMCAALYGKTSVGRSLEHMKCLSAGPEALCRLEFSFQVGTRSFRIERIPDQKRLSRRGGRETSHAHTVTLWKTTDGIDHVLATRVGTVQEHIQSIIGLSIEQFCQVVLLPQGQFEKMLRAPAPEREKVMQVLFQTDRYVAIQERLSTDARQAETEVKEALSHRDQTLQAVGCSTADELLQRHQNTIALLAHAEAARAELDTLETNARSALECGREINRKLQERDNAERAHAELQQQEPAIEADQQTIARAQHAMHIEGTDAQRSAAILDEQEALQTLENKRSLLEYTRLAKEQADHQRDREEKQLPEHLRIQEEITRLESLETMVAELAGLQAVVVSASKDVDTSRHHLRAAEQGLATVGEEIARINVRQAELSQLGGSLEDRRKALHAAEAAVERTKQAQSLRDEISELKKRLESAYKRQAEADKARKEAREQYTKAQVGWINAQAAELAKSLAPGSPCPVCGSNEHPKPAHPSSDTVDPAVLEPLQARVEEAETTLERVQSEVRDFDKDLAHATGREQILSDGASTSTKALIRDREESRKKLAEAEAAQKELPELAIELTRAKETEIQRKQDCEELRKQVLECEARLATAKGKLEQRETDVQPQYRDPTGLKRSITNEKKKLQSLKVALKNAQDAADLAREAFARQSEATLGAEKTYTKAEQWTKALREKLDREIAAEGFASEADYRMAKRSREELNALEERVAQFKNDLAAERLRLTRATEAARDLVAADLLVLEAKVNDLGQSLQQTHTRIGSLSTTIAAMSAGLQRLAELQQDIAEREKRSTVLRRLADTATGVKPKNPGFHRFVLAERLDEVLLAANRRLGPMSGERYRLERVRDEENRLVSAGLNLEVMDGYSGKTRPIDTLSGGESFLAALALALGLADVVQQHAGGVRLDTVFVDEGFGSLDPNALELAMRCLEDLRQTGRLVGVISHVAEMKERIRDAQLRVTNTHGVSQAEFVIG